MSNGDEAILEVKGLKVGIEDTPILKGIDLRIPKGEIHAIMGRNGSGKTTTANVIMGHPAYDVEEEKSFWMEKIYRKWSHGKDLEKGFSCLSNIHNQSQAYK